MQVVKCVGISKVLILECVVELFLIYKRTSCMADGYVVSALKYPLAIQMKQKSYNFHRMDF